MIRPGEMRERVTIQTATATHNALGETTLTWADTTTIWASVNGVSAREALEYGQQSVTVSHRVRFRYVATLTQNNRFKWRDRILDIVSLLEYDNRSEHVALCDEQVQ
jgi:SPP1 family predicted phage head-tail adaptor